MKSIREFCNERQSHSLDLIDTMMIDFNWGNNNPVTYALAGLISELASHGCNDTRFLHEKLDFIINQLKEGH